MLYITDADVRAANARRRGILVVPPAPPPVPMAVIRQRLRAKVSKATARKEVSAMLASAVARQRRRSTVYRSDSVSLRLQLPGETRRDYLQARVASAALTAGGGPSPEMRRFEAVLAEHRRAGCTDPECTGCR